MSELLTTYLRQVEDFRDEIERTRELLDDTYDLITAEVVNASDIRLVQVHDSLNESWTFTSGYSALVTDDDVTINHDGEQIARVWDCGDAVVLLDASRAPQVAAVLGIIAATLDERAARDELNLWYESAVYEMVAIHHASGDET